MSEVGGQGICDGSDGGIISDNYHIAGGEGGDEQENDNHSNADGNSNYRENGGDIAAMKDPEQTRPPLTTRINDSIAAALALSVPTPTSTATADSNAQVNGMGMVDEQQQKSTTKAPPPPPPPDEQLSGLKRRLSRRERQRKKKRPCPQPHGVALDNNLQAEEDEATSA
jgi:hypothetical protein